MGEKMDLQEKKCITPSFRVSFPNVFKPKSFQGQEAKFNITMLFDKNTDLKDLKRAANNALIEALGPNKAKWPKGIRTPFRDGNDKQDLAGYEDTIFVRATSKNPPGVIDQKKRPITDESGAFYPGCYARAELIAFYYDQAGNKGVSFALSNLQKTGDGEPFSGRKAAQDVFDEVESGDEDSSGLDEDDVGHAFGD